METNYQLDPSAFLRIFTKRWKIFLLLSLVSLFFAWIKFENYPDFVGTGKLIIKDNRNSQLQFLILQTANISIDKSYDSSIKEIDESSKTDAFLNSHAFYVFLAKKSRHLFSDFKNNSNDEISMMLENMVKISVQKNNIVQFDVKTPSRKLTAGLLGVALNCARNFLIENELNDLNLAESYFEGELHDVDSRIGHIENKTLDIVKSTNSIFLQSDSLEGVRYQKDLYENINQMNLLINENKTKIDDLESKTDLSSNDRSNPNKYSNSNKIVSLVSENKMLQEKRLALEKIYRNFENQKINSIPLKYEIERMKVNHEFEYKLYSSLVEKLSLLGLQKLYVQGKIQILEVDNFLRVRNSPSLKILFSVALSLSFTLSFFGIYFYELFKPQEN